MKPVSVLFILGTCGVAVPVAAQVRYEVAFPNAVHHEAEITATFSNVPDGPLELRMSRSSPGRYAIHEFAKNVYAVRVTDDDGVPLPVVRPNPYQWNVPRHGRSVIVSYTLFADRADGTYSQVDETHAHFNMPATFMWARGWGDRPIEVRFRPPAGSAWRVATQLFPTESPTEFTAPSLQYFLDSPTELSDFALREWPVVSNGNEYTIRLAVHHQGSDREVDDYAAMVKKIVAEEMAVFGETPAYEVGSYTFIADYLPHASGDGMEHRNSTILSSTGSLGANALGLLGTVSHEYFHAWNVERIRPQTLEPFDFERANMSGELWFAEGFTSYYTPLFIRRAGLIDDADYARRLGGGLSIVINSPARRLFSPVEMSMQAPFVDAATAVDPTNQDNTFISYYTWGSVIGLNLDLTLRIRYGKTLDDFMRLAWETYGKPERPYGVSDLEETLGELTESPSFAKTFFDNFVRGRRVPDYAVLLSKAGFLLRKARDGQAYLGVANLRYGADGVTVRGGTVIGTPLYDAGIDRGDRIVSLDGRTVRNERDLRSFLDRRSPGDVVSVVFVQRGREKSADLILKEDPWLEVVPYETAGLEVTEMMRAFRDNWLEGKAATTR